MKMNVLCSVFVVACIGMCASVWAGPAEIPASAKDGSFMGDQNDKLDQIQILDPQAILLLDDQKLVDVYIDALAELEATKTFHTTIRFTPAQYKQYKELVKYRLQLLFEVHRRKMELPVEMK